MSAGGLAAWLAALSVLALLLLALIFSRIRVAERRSWEVNRVKQARVMHRQGAILGRSQQKLWNLVGDELDQRSAWFKSSDLVMGVLRDNPEAVVDFLLEQQGERRVRAMLEDRIEAGDRDDD